MPTYDYECPVCANKIELFHSITEEPKEQCHACKKGMLQRIIGKGSGIIFKGSGFYATDSRKANNGSDTKQPAKAKSESGETKDTSKTTGTDSTTANQKDSAKASTKTSTKV